MSPNTNGQKKVMQKNSQGQGAPASKINGAKNVGANVS